LQQLQVESISPFIKDVILSVTFSDEIETIVSIGRVRYAFSEFVIPFEVTSEMLEACRALLFALGEEQFQIVMDVSENELLSMIEDCMTDIDTSEDLEDGTEDIGGGNDASEL
jgi:hypothetical protein